jgi:antibiotic biosynthesis monooxygenase (ABM) superfamily enzyme
LARKGGSVITRVWRGWAPTDRAQEYERHYRSEVLHVLRGVHGFEGARLLQRTTGAETEFVSLTFFDDLEAVRAFAGPDYEIAVVADEAREVLTRFDDRVSHYETAFEAS